MNIPNIYQGLEVEPPKPSTIGQIHLRGKVLSDNQFVFVPEYWEAQLKPYKKARWTHDHDEAGKTAYYELKRGNFLIFPQVKILEGGFYIARLYMIVSEMERGEQAHGEFFKDGLVIRQNRQTVNLKVSRLAGLDNFYHARLGF